MKFIHVADLHIDMPFNSLGNLGERRRIEQIENFKKLIDFVIDEKIDYLFIAGDLYEHEYIRTSTMDILVEQFKRIPMVHVIITPGNHDPYIKGSMYEKIKFPNNVRIIKGYEAFETDRANIYAYSFTDFYDKGVDLNRVRLLENGKKNIFITHGDLEVSSNYGEYASFSLDKKQYNPINKKELETIGFDYVALGHIHKSNFKEDETIIYPGSFMNYRFSEDNTGFVIGEFKNSDMYKIQTDSNSPYEHKINEKLFLEHINFDKRKYEEVNIDVTEMKTVQELVTRIQISNFNTNNYIKINLVGNKNFELNMLYIKNNITNENIIRIEDETQIGYDLEEISREKTLKGMFVKNALKRYYSIDNNINYNSSQKEIMKENILKAIEIMLEEMRNS